MTLRLLFISGLLLFADLHSVDLEQRVYVQKCTGSWYIDTQGREGDSDWVMLKCSDSQDQ